MHPFTGSPPQLLEMDRTSSAPAYQVLRRDVVAVEHPMIINNIDNGLKTFGNGKPFVRILDVDDPEGCLPLYLRHNDPMCTPILSQNSPTSNVLLKITVPKRTGKRKRSSQEPFSPIVPSCPSVGIDSLTQSNLCSHSRNDSAAKLLRSMKDNADNYQVEAVAQVQRTHRFRGLADFHHSTAHTEFQNKFQEFVLPGDAEKMKQFKLNPNRGWQKNEQFMPPPILTNENLPFNWAYHQNPHITASVNEHTGETVLTNKARARKTPLQYLAADVASVPQSSPFPIPEDDAILLVIDKLKEALNERPVWTRRALGNRVGREELPVAISRALHHVAYQFKGGPFRDTIIKYGVDPRTDKEYRKYQTLFFQMYEEDRGPQKQWKDIRTAIPLVRNIIRTDTSTHIFDGKTLALDGKVWQLCDITDPLLRRIIDNAQLREYDAKGDGYFCNGSWAKIQAIMKTKFLAIRARVAVETLDFQAAIDMPDVIEDNKKDSHRIVVPVPDVRLTDDRVEEMIKEGMDVTFLQQNGIKKRGRKMRSIRISQKLETAQKSQKRNITKRNSVDGEKSLTAEIADKLSKESEERPNQGQMVPNKGPSGSSSDNNKVPQVNTPSDEYMTAEEHVGHAKEGVEDEGDEEEMFDDDDGLEERETDEDDDNSGIERDEGQGVGEEEEEYDSDTTDILDPGTYFKPLSRPQSRS